MSFPIVKRPLIAIILIALLVSPSGWTQTQLPAMGDGGEMTAGAERGLGERIVRELYRDPDYIDDPILGEYVQSISNRDYSMIMATTLIFAVLIALANLSVDLLYAWLDPRIKLQD